jgi:hypothetical protein
MNSLHTSAIALAWLLMFPPQAERSGIPVVGPDLNAPLSEWQPMLGTDVGESGAFTSKAACYEYRAKMIADAKNRLLVGAPPGVAELPSETRTVRFTFGLAALHSNCVSSDDPRLKPK